MTYILKHSSAFLLVFLVLWGPNHARADDNKEYLIKAAFVYNFIKFVEWPDAMAINTKSKIDICVLGDSPILQTASIFNAASTAKLTLTLVQENNVKNIGNHCHVVFIGQSENARLGVLLSTLAGHPILTVSDIPDFAQAGGMIGFVIDGNKIKIDVNKKSVTTSGMRVDAQLLEIAHEVIDK